MANTSKTINILLVSRNHSVIAASRKALAREKNMRILEKEVTPDNLFSLIKETQPDTILLDFGFQENPLELLKKIASESSKCALVAILSETGINYADKVDLSGKVGFVQYPYISGNLAATIKNTLQSLDGGNSTISESSVPETDIHRKHIFTVYSPKGGVGTTTTAVNLAIGMHKALKEDVLLVDGKHLFGHVALYCNIRSNNSISDLIARAGMLDERLIRQVAVEHASGIHVLPGPYSISEAQGIRPEDLYEVIQGLQQVFSYIVVDGGNGLNENTVTYMDASGKILLVINPDLASMRDARLFLQIAGTLSYPKDKILLILNITGRKADVKREEIEKIFKMEIFGKIPADEDLAINCLNEGVPIIIKKPRHPISNAFNDIAKELIKITEETYSG